MLVIKFKAYIYLGLLLLFLYTFLLIQTNKTHGITNIKADNSTEISIQKNKSKQVPNNNGKISGNGYLIQK
jgi:hypothetical protein